MTLKACKNMRSKYGRLILAAQHLRTIHRFPRKSKIYIGKNGRTKSCMFVFMDRMLLHQAWNNTYIQRQNVYFIYHIRLGFFIGVSFEKKTHNNIMYHSYCVWCHFIPYWFIWLHRLYKHVHGTRVNVDVVLLTKTHTYIRIHTHTHTHIHT